MRDKIRLVSTAGTGYFYTTDKNKKKLLEEWAKYFDDKSHHNEQISENDNVSNHLCLSQSNAG